MYLYKMYNEYKTQLKATKTRFLNEVPFLNKLANGKTKQFATRISCVDP